MPFLQVATTKEYVFLYVAVRLTIILVKVSKVIAAVQSESSGLIHL